MVDRIHGNYTSFYNPSPANDFPNPTGNKAIDDFQQHILDLDEAMVDLRDDIDKGRTSDISNDLKVINSLLQYISKQLPPDHTGPLTQALYNQYGLAKLNKMITYLYKGFDLPQAGRHVLSIQDLVEQLNTTTNPNDQLNLLNNNYTGIEDLEYCFL